ncbi:SIMPL domain-containing protein [Halomarina litorea]|uniref:SIMPL domain-containing protein n=1 Tax=Halomarina litorea TaxID=2961595 RepID=UPI0020C59FA4|nr:SIMPL domain-containing protein [Halomarina sp. BCD28]
MRLQRQFVAAIAVAALLVLAGCTGSAVSGADAPTGDRTVQVAADGSVEVAPDRATVRVSVVEEGDAVGDVRERLAANSTEVREALESAGHDVTSARYDIDRNYRSERDPTAAEFVGRHSFVVRVDDPDAAGDAIVTAVESGAARVEQVTFGVSEETRRSLRNDALTEAMTNAETKAETVATSGDLSITGVSSVSTVSLSADPVVRERVAYASADSAGGAPTRLDAGTVTVTANVVVTYNATAA